MTFIFDTGSSWIWVPSTVCTGCKKARFNTSSTKNLTRTNKTYSITYGIGSVYGNLSTDFVSLSSNGSSNASATKFLLVTNATNLTDMMSDGVVGLSP
jgi:cathepsin D